MASDDKTRLSESASARKEHIDNGTCSALHWDKMCIECRKAVKKVQVMACACNPETGEQCMNHFDMDTYLLASELRKL